MSVAVRKIVVCERVETDQSGRIKTIHNPLSPDLGFRNVDGFPFVCSPAVVFELAGSPGAPFTVETMVSAGEILPWDIASPRVIPMPEDGEVELAIGFGTLEILSPSVMMFGLRINGRVAFTVSVPAQIMR